jgi:hypothetical protein
LRETDLRPASHVSNYKFSTALKDKIIRRIIERATRDEIDIESNLRVRIIVPDMHDK